LTIKGKRRKKTNRDHTGFTRSIGHHQKSDEGKCESNRLVPQKPDKKYDLPRKEESTAGIAPHQMFAKK